MPNPTLSDVHVSQALTNISVAYSQRQKYRTRQIFRSVGVQKQGDKYFVWDKGDLLRTDAGIRAAGDEVKVSGPRVSTDSFFCDRIALGHDIADPVRANSDPALNLDATGVEYVTDQVMLKEEVDWASAFFTTAVWDGASSSTDMTGQAAPTSTSSNFLQWNDAASTPIEDIRGEMTAVEQKTGYRPNVLALGPQVWTALADHPDIVDRIKYTERGIVSTDLLASLLDLERVEVLRATRNTAAEEATDSYSFVAGKSGLLAYVPASPGLMTPAAGYTFVWTGAGVPAEGVRIKRYRLERNESDRIEGETWLDHKVVASGLGAFFASAVA